MNEECIICDSQNQFRCVSSSELESRINCPVCGTYTINLKSFSNVNKLIEATEKLSEKNYIENERKEKKALLRYYVKQYAKSAKSSENDSNILRVDTEFCKEIFKNPFPNPIEQANYLITFLGNTLNSTHKPYHAEKLTIENLISNAKTLEQLEQIKPIVGDIGENLRQGDLISATASIDYDNVWRIVDHAKELNFVKYK
ncbi:MAG: hypothetical protein LE168_03030 [Endomicrobium sp.]|nr:hypothetical protein [Endomicrobium sp.]